MSNSDLPGQQLALLKKLYYKDGLSQRQVAYRMHIPIGRLRAIMKAEGLLTRSTQTRFTRPSKLVIRYEERPYEEMTDGRLKTKTVAILECGHITKVWEKLTLPYKTEYRHYRHCRVCPVEEKEPSDGGTEH